MATLLSFVVVEASLRIYYYKLNQPQSFQFIDNAIPTDITQVNEKKNGYNRDHTSEIFSSIKDSTIQLIGVGDSFTNGGNLDYTHSYPYNLYKQLDKRFKVFNYGICESTSNDSIFNIKRFYKENTTQKKKNIFLVLTGATDLFFQDPDSNIHNIDRAGLRQEKRLIDQHYLGSPLLELKSIQLLKYYYRIYSSSQQDEGLKQQITTRLAFKNSFKSNEINSCLKQKLSIQANCLAKKILELKDHDQKRRMAILMASYFRQYRYTQNSQYYTDHIKALEIYYLKTGHLLEDVDFLDFVATVSFISMKQSTLSIKEINHIIERLEQKFKTKLSNYKLFQEAKYKLTYWLQNTKILRKRRQQNLEAIIDLIVQKRDQIILLTYPLKYTEVNEDIRSIAIAKKIPYIDLELLFANFKQTNPNLRLINDGQHCTKEGYQLMAKFISEYLNKNILNP